MEPGKHYSYLISFAAWLNVLIMTWVPFFADGFSDRWYVAVVISVLIGSGAGLNAYKASDKVDIEVKGKSRIPKRPPPPPPQEK